MFVNLNVNFPLNTWRHTRKIAHLSFRQVFFSKLIGQNVARIGNI